ncbi:MAG: hypothetical protein ABI867_19580 [Kofleriaceae bacterium]
MPWFVWASIVSVTSILVGVYWDISWHMTVGRDSFWTPAHLAIQLGGIIAGIAGSFLIVTTTLRRTAPLRESSIGVWGFRGPFGAFLAVWGAAAMLVSAPFDNWWHSAYGLDVKILSPPHAVLTLGILGVTTGGVLQIVAVCNRATGALRRRLELAMLATAGAITVLAMTAILEHTFRSNLHTGDSYRAIAIVAPLILLAFGHASGRRWGATIIAATYTGFMLAMLWLFPLFGAEPKLGPVYQPITHMIPLEFPVLIVVPAIALDLIRAHVRLRRVLLACVLGTVFVGVMIAVEWPFASFAMTEPARNAVFGSDYHPYFAQPEWYGPRHEFFPDPAFASGMIHAVIAAVLGSWLGLTLGNAMRGVRR